MDLDVTFGDKTMQTPVYIKLDAPDQLLLLEGVCRQLGIVTYHRDVCSHNGVQKARQTDRKRELRHKLVWSEQSIFFPIKALQCR